MPNNCKQWTKDEEDFIRSNYTEMSDDEIGNELKRSMRSIRSKRQRLGLFRYFQESSAPIKGEEWKPVVEHPSYIVSNKGRIKNKLGKFLKPHVHKSGYVIIAIDGKTLYLHKLVKESFCGETPRGMEIDHIDCNKLNNSLYNLEFVTHQDNMQRAVDNKCFKHLFGR